MSGPDFTDEMFREQSEAFLGAVDALRAGDPIRAADLLAGPSCDDTTCYARAVTLCVIGAALIANQIAKVNGHQLGDAPGLYVLRGPALDAHQQCAAQCITYAANGDFTTVADLVNAHHQPGDIEPGSSLLLALVDVYAGITGGGE